MVSISCKAIRISSESKVYLSCTCIYAFVFYFSVGFRTTPMDSTGVSHILEHTVLCGSQRYPVRDPFFKMLNRSLSTFMNAFTGMWYLSGFIVNTCNNI